MMIEKIFVIICLIVALFGAGYGIYFIFTSLGSILEMTVIDAEALSEEDTEKTHKQNEEVKEMIKNEILKYIISCVIFKHNNDISPNITKDAREKENLLFESAIEVLKKLNKELEK